MVSEKFKDFMYKIMVETTGSAICTSCNKPFSECIDNLFSEKLMSTKDGEEFEKTLKNILNYMPEAPPLRSHDHDVNANVPDPLTTKQRILGLKVQANYMLDEIESLLDVVS